MAATKKTPSKKTTPASPSSASGKKTARKVAAGKSAAKKTSSSGSAKKAVGKTPSPPAKTTARGAAKTAAKKAVSKKAVPKKAAAKKAPARKTAAKKAPAKKATARKVSAPKASSSGSGRATAPVGGEATKKAAKKKAAAPAPSPAEASLREREEMIRKRTRKDNPGAASSTSTPSFTLTDVRDYLQQQKASPETAGPVKKKGKATKGAAKKTARKGTTAAAASTPAKPRKSQSFGAASVADLLGFDPTQKDETAIKDRDESEVPRKFLTYFRSLLQLHEEVLEGLHRHSEETLRRSSKEDSGDLSSYGQHMADAGTESYERDFALSLVSSEQEALYEIDEALRRIREGTYGICEITGKPISRERLRAVPFTRYSVEGQREVEKRQTRQVQRAGIQSSLDGDESPVLGDDESGDE